MLNLNQSSLMIEGSLRGILSSQEGKSFEEIISFSKYIIASTFFYVILMKNYVKREDIFCFTFYC